MPASDDRLTAEQRRVRDVRRNALAKALADARRDAGLTQEQLAAASGVSRAVIARVEAGTASISSDRIWSLAAALGTTPSRLWAAAEADPEVRGTAQTS